MKIAVLICRFFLGLSFITFGLNILHPFLPQPPPFPEGSLTAHFIAAMGPSHWMQFVGALQVLGGALLLYCPTVPLGLTILAPILVNILAFHIFMMKGAGIGPGVVFTALELFLIYSYKDFFMPIITGKLKSTDK